MKITHKAGNNAVVLFQAFERYKKTFNCTIVSPSRVKRILQIPKI